MTKAEFTAAPDFKAYEAPKPVIESPITTPGNTMRPAPGTPSQ